MCLICYQFHKSSKFWFVLFLYGCLCDNKVPFIIVLNILVHIIYIIYVLKILDMTMTELEHLSRHLGHDSKTHKDFYRLSHSTVQLSKVSESFY